MRTTIAALALVLLTSSAGADELYIVPAYGYRLVGVDSTWDSVVRITNPDDNTVMVELGVAMPMAIEWCGANCVGESTWVLGPMETRVIIPAAPRPGYLLLAGAFTLSASAPIEVSSVVFSVTPTSGGMQRIQTGSRWIEPTETALIPDVLLPSAGFRTNLFLANPNPYSIEVSVTVEGTSLDPFRTEVPPESLVVRSLSEFICGNEPCLTIGEWPPRASTLRATGSGNYYVSTSSVSRYDAVFSGPVTRRADRDE